LNDNQLLLAGALPSAALALLTQALFEWLERRLTRTAASSALPRPRA
jgi:osmoprotectant transport system permease protein